MNYYRRYVGDYLRKTARLSMLEHGAYNLLLDYYYAEEKPLPLDVDEICRMVRAIRTEERKAIERVLALKFNAQSDGYHNDRADAEMRIASTAIETAKENGKLGGRPRKNLQETGWVSENGENGTPEKPNGLNLGSEKRGYPQPRNNHPPSAIHQPLTTNPQPSSKPSAESEQISLSASFEWEGVTDERRKLWIKAYPAIDIDLELAAAAVWVMENPRNRKSNWGRFLIAWLKRSQDKAPARGGGKPQIQQVLCEFRGDPFNPQTDPCGMPQSKTGALYGGRALCPHHQRVIDDSSRLKTTMPDDVRTALNDLVRNKTVPAT